MWMILFIKFFLSSGGGNGGKGQHTVGDLGKIGFIFGYEYVSVELSPSIEDTFKIMLASSGSISEENPKSV